ncbi:NUMOD3 domain-containing DNA-binding protein [Bacillus cereus]|uniref:NUMOD3 domain-containing DNA-binding protein n=2 Tax=Bacillus cereus TaxID=1396 RepID=UPI000BFE168A|nr:NUMOD3 domain-containing DNA-binding protein [Bacillus cereus]PGU82098.1 hypothetical protein COD76_11410 [Bacillus cereus]
MDIAFNKDLLDLRYVIYKFTNLVNGKVYIGLTSKTLERRLTNHEAHVRNGYRNHFYNSVRKYGWENFKCEVIDQIHSEDDAERIERLKEREKYWISYYKSFIGFDDCNGYNATLGGDGSWGRIASDETREKISKKITGMFSGERNHCWGKFGEEHPAFGRENKWGIHTEETKKRIGEANIGEKNPNYGKHGANHHCSKPIVMFDMDGRFIREYESISDGAVDIGGFVQSISQCCSDKLMSAHGYQWMYKDDYDKMIREGLKPKKVKSSSQKKSIVRISDNGESVEEYESIRKAALSLGKKTSTVIIRCLKGDTPLAYGYKWMYKEDYEKMVSED